MFTFIILAAGHYSVETFFGTEGAAERRFDEIIGRFTVVTPMPTVLAAGEAIKYPDCAVFFYGPEGQINNWVGDR